MEKKALLCIKSNYHLLTELISMMRHENYGFCYQEKINFLVYVVSLTGGTYTINRKPRYNTYIAIYHTV